MRLLILIPWLAGCGGATQVLVAGDASSDVQTTGDSATIVDGGGPPVLPCGTTTCTGGDVCCVDNRVQPATYACQTTCAGGTTSLQCNGNDCGNLVCCVYQLTTGGAASACMASCPNGQAQLCQASDAGATTGCAADAGCSSRNIGDWGLSPPYGTCGGLGN